MDKPLLLFFIGCLALFGLSVIVSMLFDGWKPQRRLLFWWTGHLRVRFIKGDSGVYLERYYIGTLFDRRYYFHRFVGSDPDRGYHDHPWCAWSLILCGWYWELKRSGLHAVRFFNRINEDTFHRVILPDIPGGCDEVWTLFSTPTRDAKEWGFLIDKGQLGTVFSPFTYPGGKKNPEWWLDAPKGKNSERVPF